MREFAFASEEDFLDLESILSDGALHVFANRVLPQGCEPCVTRVGFEKRESGFAVMVDEGIQAKNCSEDLAFLIKNGEVTFPGMDDMMEFFHSLQPIFLGETSSQPGPIYEEQLRKEEEPEQPVIVDKEKLKTLREERKKKKTVWPEEIADPLKKKVFGQNAVIDALADSIVVNRMRKTDKLLVMAFLGPPATGKSTVGRELADILSRVFEVPYGFLDIAASEYTQEHMVQKFLGAPSGYVGHGGKTVLDPVRKNPYHIILIDEIEKAHEKLLLTLMEAMDTGFLGMADNSPALDLRHCILIFTSNLPIDMGEYQIASEFERAEMCKDAFTRHCGRPEISRRIQDFMVFVPLTEEAKVDVIIKFAKQALKDMDAELVKVDEHLMDEFLGLQTKYGASELGNYVTRAIGKEMLKSRQPDLVKGKKIILMGTIENIVFQIA